MALCALLLNGAPLDSSRTTKRRRLPTDADASDESACDGVEMYFDGCGSLIGLGD
jgi:hypothetical protein